LAFDDEGAVIDVKNVVEVKLSSFQEGGINLSRYLIIKSSTLLEG